MKVRIVPTESEIRERRRAAYLARYPIEAQLEAYAENAAGRPEKLNEMLSGMDEIRARNPKPDESQGVE
jgi:hypothetical protein